MAEPCSNPPRRRALRALGWVGIGVGALIVVLVLTAGLMDWNAMRGPIARLASAKSGRPVHIDGDLHVQLFSLAPRITVNELKVGNPRWAGPGSLAEVRKLDLRVKLLPLLVGNIVLPNVHLEKPTFNLVTNADGRANWATARTGRPQGGVAPSLPLIQRFDVGEARVTYVDRKRHLEFSGVAAANEVTRGRASQPFRLVGTGKLNDQPFRFEMRGGALLNARRDKPYAFDADLVSGSTRATAHGAIAKPFDLSAVAADMTIKGDDLSDLYYLTGLALPNSPPYEVSGRVARKGTRIDFHNMAGTVGDSDMHGELSVELKGERPFLQAQLASQSLDLDDIATWFGAPPSARKGETASPTQKVAQEEMVASRRLFPDAQLKVERVRAMDARVTYEAAQVRSERFPMQTLSMNSKLENGVLTMEPVSFAMPQGKITGTLSLDAQQDVPNTHLDARITGVQLAQFRPKDGTQPPLNGLLQGRVKLEGRGNSVHRFLASSNGNATFVVPHGEVREAFAELTGINVARGLGLLMTGDQQKTDVRCGVADLKATDGSLHVQNLVFDTDNVLITGRGGVSLEQEEFDLSIRGQPKKMRLLRVRSPIAIHGPLRKPALGVEGSKALAQAGVAVALGVLATPLAAVVAFVDPGLAKDANCSALLAEAKADGAPVKTADITNADRAEHTLRP